MGWLGRWLGRWLGQCAFTDEWMGYDSTQPWWVYAPPGITDADAWLRACRQIDPSVPSPPDGWVRGEVTPQLHGCPSVAVYWPPDRRQEIVNLLPAGWEPLYGPVSVVTRGGQVYRVRGVPITQPVLVRTRADRARWDYMLTR